MRVSHILIDTKNIQSRLQIIAIVSVSHNTESMSNSAQYKYVCMCAKVNRIL